MEYFDGIVLKFISPWITHVLSAASASSGGIVLNIGTPTCFNWNIPLIPRAKVMRKSRGEWGKTRTRVWKKYFADKSAPVQGCFLKKFRGDWRSAVGNGEEVVEGGRWQESFLVKERDELNLKLNWMVKLEEDYSYEP